MNERDNNGIVGTAGMIGIVMLVGSFGLGGILGGPLLLLAVLMLVASVIGFFNALFGKKY